jgi:hypothetical protein
VLRKRIIGAAASDHPNLLIDLANWWTFNFHWLADASLCITVVDGPSTANGQLPSNSPAKGRLRSAQKSRNSKGPTTPK